MNESWLFAVAETLRLSCVQEEYPDIPDLLVRFPH